MAANTDGRGQVSIESKKGKKKKKCLDRWYAANPVFRKGRNLPPPTRNCP